MVTRRWHGPAAINARPLQGEARTIAFFSAVRPYLTAIEEMQHYLVTEVTGPGKASFPS